MKLNFRYLIWVTVILILFGAVGAFGQRQDLQVKDKNGEPVRNAEVTVVCADKDVNGFANNQGIITFNRNGQSTCWINVGHPDFDPFEGQIDFSKGEGGIYPIVLRRRLAGALEIAVTDSESKAPVVGADITIDCGMDRWGRTTDASGRAVVNKTIKPGTCQIQAEHSDYDNAASTLTVPYEAGRSVTASIKMNRKVHIKTVRITVVDSSDETKTIEDAHITMTGPWATTSSGSTAANGVAKLRIDRPGRFRVEVTRDNYFPFKTIFDVAPGAANEGLEITVALAKKKGQAIGAPVLIYVRGQRLDGTVVDLDNASVTPEGGEPKFTWKDGKTTVTVPGLIVDSVQVVAAREGFESETKSITVPRLSTLLGAPSLTFILREKKAEVTGVNLVIEVTNKSDDKPISGASVSIAGYGNSTTDSDGYARFTISKDSIKDKQYLRAIAAKSAFKEKWSDIGIDSLKPSEEPRYILMQMEPIKDSLPGLKSGTYDVVASSHKSTWVLTIVGNTVTGTSSWDCCPGKRTDPLTGTITDWGTSGVDQSLKVMRDCEGQGFTGPCKQEFTIIVSKFGSGAMNGQIYHNGSYLSGVYWQIFLQTK